MGQRAEACAHVTQVASGRKGLQTIFAVVSGRCGEPHTLRKHRMVLVQPQRIIMKKAAPATNASFTSDAQLSTNTFRM